MIDQALYQLLTTHAGVATRVTPSTETVLVHKGLPRIVYSLIDTQRRYSDHGNSGLTQARYQLDIFAEKATEARAVADRVRIGADGFKGTLADTPIVRVYFGAENFEKGERVEGADKTVARISQDVFIEYRETTTVTP